MSEDVFNIEPILEKYIKSLANIELSIQNSTASIVVISEIYDFYEDKKKLQELIHSRILFLKNIIENNHNINGIGLFGGLTDIAFAISIVEKKTKNYSNFLNKLNMYLDSTILKYIDYLESNYNKLSFENYDTISGISGVVNYYLSMRNDNKSLFIIERCKRYLIGLTNEVTYKNNLVPGWYIKNKFLATRLDKRNFPNGLLNNSLSHGIAGPLIVLVLIGKKIGIDYELNKSIKYISNYLKENIVSKNNLPFWIGKHSIDDYIQDKRIDDYLEIRVSWCYGSISNLYSLKLAGEILEDSYLSYFACKNIEKFFELDINSLGLVSPTICHGISGYILQYFSYIKSTNNKIDSCYGDTLIKKIIDQFDNKSIHGYRNKEYILKNDLLKEEFTEEDSLLCGSAGVILTLLFATGKPTIFQKYFYLN